MLGSIVFIKGQEGLGRPLAGSDYISGMLFYTANSNLPSGYSTTNRYLTFFQASDAQTKGGVLPNFNANNIFADANFADATAATGEITFTAAPSAAGDTVVITANVLGLNGVVTTYTLCTYKTVSGDTTDTLLATHVTSEINGNTLTTGYSATSAIGVVTIIAPKSQGVWGGLNSGANANLTLTITETSGTAGTVTDAIGAAQVGVPSKQAVWNYHISEYFRLQPKGQLTVGFNAIGGLANYTFTEITAMQRFAKGSIRQAAIYQGGDSHAYTSGDLTAIQAEITTNDDAQHMPLSVWLGANVEATTDLSTLTNLNTLSANKASVTVGQDGANFGAFLFATCGYSITDVGAKLGMTSFVSVSTSITWVANCNMTNGAELSVPAFANGQIVSAQPQSYLTAIDNNGYNYLLGYVDNAGTYNSDSLTATNINSDYAYLENNRTIDKACRGIYQGLLPAIGAPIVLNADGTLTDTSIAYFTSLAEGGLTEMFQNQELSGDPTSGNIPLGTVVISSTQNVLSTGVLVVSVNLIPIGVARKIQVNIQFVTSLSSN